MSRPMLSNLSRYALRASSRASPSSALPTRCAAKLPIGTLPPRHRNIHLSATHRAEEAPGLPFESDIMNLLSNNEEFKETTFRFAGRLQKLLNIDVSAGQMPSPKDMMTVTTDPELREMSIKMTKILSDSNINLSEGTLKHIWEMLSTGKKA